MEYRVSFLLHVFSMAVNNVILISFWFFYFERFKQIQGYSLNEILLLYAVVSVGYGLGLTFAGNTPFVAYLVASGKVDYFLSFPRPVLPHLLFNRLNIFSIGDVFFGIFVFWASDYQDLTSIGLFSILVLCIAVFIVSLLTLLGSTSFFIGNAQLWVSQFQTLLSTFAIYPTNIFGGVVRLLLLTVIPASIIGSLPMSAIINTDYELLAFVALVSFGTLLLMIIFFNIGLRRYESGSAMNINN